MPLSASSAVVFTTKAMEDEEDIRPTVVDVYDLAADIGKEFEAIIDQYGPEVLTNLMPRVITTLEQLEKLAEKQETSGATIEELRSTIRVLEHQQIGLTENKNKYVRDLEDIEKDMREEKQELSDRVSRLLDENRKLSTCLARSADNTPSLTDEESSLEPDVSTISRLQDTVEGHKTQLNRLQSELQNKHTENKQLSSQVEHLTQSNKDLRRRARQGTHQIKQLVEERAELHVTLQEHQRSIDQLNQRLGLAAKENFDLATASTSEPCDMSTKLVYDRSDPNRPRFTLTELKDILYQRNELKARVSDLEDELSVYRPPKQQYVICVHNPVCLDDDDSDERASGEHCDDFEGSLCVWEDYCCSSLTAGMCNACGAVASSPALCSTLNRKAEHSADALLAELRADLRKVEVLSKIIKSDVLSRVMVKAISGLEVACEKCQRLGTLTPMENVDWGPAFESRNRPHEILLRNLSQFVEVRGVCTLVKNDSCEMLQSVDCCNKSRLSTNHSMNHNVACLHDDDELLLEHVAFSSHYSRSPTFYNLLHNLSTKGDKSKRHTPSLLCVDCVDLDVVSLYLGAEDSLSSSADNSLCSNISSDSAVNLSSLSSTSSTSLASTSSHVLHFIRRVYGGVERGGREAVGDSLVLLVTLQWLIKFLLVIYRGIFLGDC